MDRSKVIAPCFVFHGWWSGPRPGFLLVPALRPSTRVKPLAGGPGTSLSHCRALHKNGDPNLGLFSRPRLAVDEREHGLPLGDHQYLASLIFIFVALPGVLAMIHICDPSAVPSLQMVDGSVVILIVLIVLFVFSLEYLGVRRPV